MRPCRISGDGVTRCRRSQGPASTQIVRYRGRVPFTSCRTILEIPGAVAFLLGDATSYITGINAPIAGGIPYASTGPHGAVKVANWARPKDELRSAAAATGRARSPTPSPGP